MNDRKPVSQSRPPAPPPGAMRWLFFSASGRIGRTLFVLGWLYLSVVNGLMIALLIGQSSNGDPPLVLSLMALAVGGFTLWPSAMLTVKRLHDVDLAGAFAILIFVPALSIILLVGLSLWKGTPGPNSYGDRSDAP